MSVSLRCVSPPLLRQLGFTEVGCGNCRLPNFDGTLMVARTVPAEFDFVEKPCKTRAKKILALEFCAVRVCQVCQADTGFSGTGYNFWHSPRKADSNTYFKRSTNGA